MNERKHKYSKEEHARLGTALYENRIRAMVEGTGRGRIVAIDVDSGIYEVADDMISAADAVLSQNPDAQIWFVRIGHAGVHRFRPRIHSRKL